jgi:hypothetical protein
VPPPPVTGIPTGISNLGNGIGVGIVGGAPTTVNPDAPPPSVPMTDNTTVIPDPLTAALLTDTGISSGFVDEGPAGGTGGTTVDAGLGGGDSSDG